MENNKERTLRQKAETSINNLDETNPISSEAQTLKLLHELQVHQIELEMQNDELLFAKRQAEEAIEQYSDLFNFAPVGYFSLSNEGEIVELNLAASKMLGIERSLLKYRFFNVFISTDSKAKFNHFLQNAFSSKNNELCELILNPKDKLPRYVQLNGKANENGEQCFITVIDLTERKKTEDLLYQNDQKLQCLLDMRNLTDSPQEKIIDFANKSISISLQSPFSFIGLVNGTETVMSIYSGSESVLQQYGGDEKSKIYPIDGSEIWGKCIKQKEAVIVNNYENKNTNKKANPLGQVPIKRIIAIPVIDNEKVFAVAVAANKETDYNNFDTKVLMALMNNALDIIKRNLAENELKRVNEELESRFKKRTQDLFNANILLKQAENRLQVLLSSVTDFIFTVIIENGKIKKVIHGEGCIAITGYSKKEFDND